MECNVCHQSKSKRNIARRLSGKCICRDCHKDWEFKKVYVGDTESLFAMRVFHKETKEPKEVNNE